METTTKKQSKYNWEKRQGLRKWIDATGKQISEIKNYLKDYTRHHTVQWKKFEGTHDGPGKDGWNKNIFQNVVPTNWHRVAPMENVNMRELERIQKEFRVYHVAASMMRGKTLEEIETLPTRETKVGPYYNYGCNKYGYDRTLNMNKVNNILKEYENEITENVCSGNGRVDIESTSGSSWTRPGGVHAEEKGNGSGVGKSNTNLLKGFKPGEVHSNIGG